MGGTPSVVAPTPTSGILREGDSGADVKQLQTQLTDAGYPCGTIDGLFGAKTKSALSKFQTDNGLVADGIYGPNTKAKLDEVMKKRATPTPAPAVSPTPVPDHIVGTLKVIAHTVLRKEASASSEIIRAIDSGEYIVHEYKNGWYQIGGWINAKYVQFVPYNETKITKE
jgi:peptidoglycan hydrolase-like protein with peptidoglycan-binding domain